MSSLSRHFLPSAMLGTTLLTSPLLAQIPADKPEAEDLVVGTWILNLERSAFDPGPGPASQTRTYRPDGDRMKATITTVDSEGRTISSEYVAGYDSLEYPFTGSPNFDTISLRRVNAYVAEATLRHAQVIIGTAEREIARDGKSMIIRYKGTDQRGRQVEVVAHYDKQTTP